MKKAYNQPSVKVVKIQVAKVMATSIEIKAAGGNGTVLGREDNSWNIWGDNADEDFED